ncbi:MAG: hypothetical protein ACREJ9_18335 [Candidatus Rokuibacteriota bacterium]
MDSEDLKRFIHSRLLSHPKFRTVIAVSVEKYPEESLAKVWVGEEPTQDMRQYGYELESELANLGVRCSIIIKADRELPFGGTPGLRTRHGEFSYRYYRVDAVKDEDDVYVFTVFRGKQTYRFRMALTGTLASMLRDRGRFNEEKILEIYRDWIRGTLDEENLAPDQVHEKMFNSRDLALFGVA